jgi:hypothetical protein
MDYSFEYLTEEQKIWFGDRMTEGRSGAVQIPTRLYDKFRKITGNPFLKNNEIKSWLIEKCY